MEKAETTRGRPLRNASRARQDIDTLAFSETRFAFANSSGIRRNAIGFLLLSPSGLRLIGSIGIIRAT